MSLAIYIVISVCVIFWVWRKKENFSLNSDSLQKQWLFRLAILFPLMSSLYFMIWLGSSYPFRWDAIGYNGFLEINKFSLGILALSPILGAFIVYMHRSLQSETQIKTSEMQLKEAQKKNKVDIYFSRRKFIIERLIELDTGFVNKINNANYVYDGFYIFNDYVDEVKNESFKLINNRIELIIDNINTISSFHENMKNKIILSNEVVLANTNLLGLSTSLLRMTGVTLKEKIKIRDYILQFSKEYSSYRKCLRNSPCIKHKNETDLEEMLGQHLLKLKEELNEIHEFLTELFSILLLDKNIIEYLPSLNKLQFDDGDKLAAENQNPPE